MVSVRPLLASMCAVALLAPPGGFAAGGQAGQSAAQPSSNSWFKGLTQSYRARPVPPPSLVNSSRLDSLLRGGNIYLSLQDCIALALENNLDIEIQRYLPRIAEAGMMATHAGGPARTITTNVTAGPTSSSVNGVGVSVTAGTGVTAAGAVASGAV